jgi:hypothetical protein
MAASFLALNPAPMIKPRRRINGCALQLLR